MRFRRPHLRQIRRCAELPTESYQTLCGSCWKRLAQVEQGQARDAALQKMAECYDRAVPKASKDGALYPQLQWAAAGIARKHRSGRALPPKLRSIVGEIAEMPKDLDDFWRDIAAIDAEILGAVLQGSLTRDEELKLLELYRNAWRFGGSPLKLMSVLEQFAFLVDVLADAPKAMIPLTEALGRMRSTLESHLRSSSRGVYRAVS
jgi:hypothetical protein